jgi:hypothetical protein
MKKLMMSSKIHELCRRCIKTCKQSTLVTIVKCPLFVPNNKSKEPEYGNSEHEVSPMRKPHNKRRKTSD